MVKKIYPTVKSLILEAKTASFRIKSHLQIANIQPQEATKAKKRKQATAIEEIDLHLNRMLLAFIIKTKNFKVNRVTCMVRRV